MFYWRSTPDEPGLHAPGLGRSGMGQSGLPPVGTRAEQLGETLVDTPGVEWAFTCAGEPGPDVAALDGPQDSDFGGFNLGGHVGDDPAQVEVHRESLAAALDVPRDHLLFMAQCHGTQVLTVDAPWQGEPPAVDGIITTNPDLALAVLVADCVPLLLADASAGVVGAVHAGRPGMLGGIVPRALEAMAQAGARDLHAVVGPSVCGRCYEVPAAMRDEAAEVSAASVAVTWAGTPAIDVAAGVVDQLVAGGASVTWVPGCTRESPRLYSYRRRSRTGRFAGVVRRRVA